MALENMQKKIFNIGLRIAPSETFDMDFTHLNDFCRGTHRLALAPNILIMKGQPKNPEFFDPPPVEATPVFKYGLAVVPNVRNSELNSRMRIDVHFTTSPEERSSQQNSLTSSFFA